MPPHFWVVHLQHFCIQEIEAITWPTCIIVFAFLGGVETLCFHCFFSFWCQVESNRHRPHPTSQIAAGNDRDSFAMRIFPLTRWIPFLNRSKELWNPKIWFLRTLGSIVRSAVDTIMKDIGIRLSGIETAMMISYKLPMDCCIGQKWASRIGSSFRLSLPRRHTTAYWQPCTSGAPWMLGHRYLPR